MISVKRIGRRAWVFPSRSMKNKRWITSIGGESLFGNSAASIVVVTYSFFQEVGAQRLAATAGDHHSTLRSVLVLPFQRFDVG